MGETIRASEQRLYRGPKRVTRVEAFAGVYLRAIYYYSRDYFANFLRLKVLNF